MRLLSQLKLRHRLMVMFLVAGLVPAAIVGGLAIGEAGESLEAAAFGQLQAVRQIKREQIEGYFAQRRSEMAALVDAVDTLRSEAFAKLEAIQAMKQRQLEGFFEERLGDVTVLARNAALADALTAFTESFAGDGDRVGGAAWSTAEERHADWLAEYQTTYGYYDLFLISARGDVVYSVAQEGDLGADLQRGPLADSGLGRAFAAGRQQPVVEDFASYAPSGGAQAAFMAAPVKGAAGELLGVVALQIPLEPINAIVQDRTGLGHTGESFLVGQTAVGMALRSDRVVEGGGELVLGTAFSDRYAEAALAGRSGVDVESDAAGELKAVAYAPLDVAGLHWALLTTQQLEEIFTGSTAAGEKDFLARYNERYGYYDLFLIHPEGDVFYTVAKESDYGTNLISGKYRDSGLGRLFRQVLESGEFGFQDFAPYAPSAGEPAAFIARPLRDGDRVQLVVALQLPLEHINAIMQQREGMGETGETYLVGPDKRMRSDSYLDAEGRSVRASFAGTVQDNGVDTPASNAALAGETGAEIIIDYNGNPVLSAFAPVEAAGTTWALLAEIDESEALAAVTRLKTRTAVVAAVAVLAVVALAVWIANSIAGPIRRAVDVARSIARGDLTSTIVVDRTDEVGDMQVAMKTMNERLREIVGGVREGSEMVTAAAGEIARGSADLSQRTEEQASSLEETASSMEEMTATVRQNADNAAHADRLSDEAKSHAQQGTSVISRTITAMGEISESSRRIEQIISVIDEIAFQTNLLALNAAVEAARAGEQGRGFAVVAGEVRKLAQRSGDSARDIKGLITESVAKAQDGQRYVEESGRVLEEILESTSKVSGIVSEIAAASLQQSAGIEQVNKAVTQMDEVTQQNAALVEEAAASAQVLSDQAQALRERMLFFRVEAGESAQPARHEAARG